MSAIPSTCISLENAKMDNINSGNVQVVIKAVGNSGIVIPKGFTDKDGVKGTQYFLNVDQGVAVDNEDTQFVPVEDDCEGSEEAQFVTMEVGDAGQIILHNKDVIIYDELCRICANPSDRFIPIFSEEGLEHNLQEKIHTYLPFQVSENDSLPLQVCYNCAATLLSWHELYKDCLESQQRLMELQSKLHPKEQYYNDSTVEEENIENILEVETSNNEEAQTEDKEENDAQALHIITASELDRSDTLQTSVKKSFDVMIANKDTVDKMENKKANADKGERWMTVAHFAKCTPDSSTLPDSQSMSDENDAGHCHESNKTKKLNQNLHKAKRNLTNKSYDCNDCGKKFNFRDSLLRHARIHKDERPFTCHICGKQFRDSGGLWRHIRDVHAKVKNFSCEFCEKTFAAKATKDDHQRIHTGERPYVCDTCGMCFKSKSSLYMHSKIHTDEFPHPCVHCNKKFRRKQELVAHISTHTGEKNFECDICQRRFRLKSELKRHTFIHSDEKPFVCDICDFRSRQRRYLNNHMKQKHNNVVKDESNT